METKKDMDFIKTRPITSQEIEKLLSEAQGKSVKLNEFPENTHWVLKIKEEPTITVYEGETKKQFKLDDKIDYDFEALDDNGKKKYKASGYMRVEYKFNKDTRVPILLRVSKHSLDKFNEHNKGKDYIDKYAMFSLKKVGDNNVHSIGVIYKEDYEPFDAKEFIDPMDIIRKAQLEKPVELDDDTKIKEFMLDFKKQVEAFNKQQDENKTPEKRKPYNANLCQLQYFRKFYPQEYQSIETLFGD